MTLIGFLSDFGLRDAYIAQIKAVILSASPIARIIDISHEIEKYNIQQGMFVLASATAYFPPSSIFLAVVDPEVGSLRKALLIETRTKKFVGPDNGILTLAAEKEGIVNTYHLTESKYFASKVSPTFHGRDIFAPVVGHLANGIAPSLMGHLISQYVRLKISEADLKGHSIQGTIIHIDHFGNIVTNIKPSLLESGGFKFGSRLKLKIKNKTRTLMLAKIYSDVASSKMVATIGSHGYLEIAVNKADAAKLLEVRVGTPIVIQRVGLSF